MKWRAPVALFVICASVCASLALTGCKRSPEDLEVWRPSKAENGLDKLQEWLASDSEPMEVRIRAAEILFEEDFAYAVDASLEKSSKEDAKAIANALLPTVKAWYDTQDATAEKFQARESQQYIGKEAAFRLEKYADGEAKEAYRTMLADWISEEFLLRDQMGTAKFAQIAEVLGPSAAPPLLKALEVPSNNQKHLADMLRKIDDPKVKEKVADTLVKMGSEQLPKMDTDLEVAVLEEDHPNVVPLLVKIVDDRNADVNLRDAAHSRIGVIKKRDALPHYLKWVKSGPDALRWVSIQAIAENSGKAGLMPILASLPDDGKYGSDDPEEGFMTDANRFCMVEVKEEIVDKGANVTSIFVKTLQSPKASVAARAVSLACLGTIGDGGARPAVEALTADKSPIPAWGDKKTLGDLASDTLKKLPRG